jgi:hypothetical protein
MTVGELRARLAGFEDDTLVVLSEDSEGNGFSPLADVGRQAYIADSTWSGEVREIGPLTEALTTLGFEAADLVTVGQDGAVLAAVLWPTR